jgi:hypothetical protein
LSETGKAVRVKVYTCTEGERETMWAYTVWLKGRKDPIRFELADPSMLSDWEAWQTGDTTKRVGVSKAPTVGAVFNFEDVIGMHAQELPPDPGPEKVKVGGMWLGRRPGDPANR